MSKIVYSVARMWNYEGGYGRDNWFESNVIAAFRTENDAIRFVRNLLKKETDEICAYDDETTCSEVNEQRFIDGRIDVFSNLYYYGEKLYPDDMIFYRIRIIKLYEDGDNSFYEN